MSFDLVLNVGRSSIATAVPLEADGVTVTPGASLSAQSWSLTDPSLTATTNPDGTLTIAGVAASGGPVSGTVTATATDSDGTTAPFTQTFTVTVAGVTPPPPTNRTAGLGVFFSTPV